MTEEARIFASSNMDRMIDEVLKNNFMSLKTLNFGNCKGLTCLTPGVAIEHLVVSYCQDLSSINVAEGSAGLKYVTIINLAMISWSYHTLETVSALDHLPALASN